MRTTGLLPENEKNDSFFSRKRRAPVVGSGKGSGAKGIISRPSSSTGELCGGTLGSRACCRTAGGGGSVNLYIELMM